MANEIDLVGVNLPANVMLPNSSSTLYLGNRLNMSNGKSIIVDGEVMRMALQENGTIMLHVGNPEDSGQKRGRMVLFPSGMIALVKPVEQPQAVKK